MPVDNQVVLILCAVCGVVLTASAVVLTLRRTPALAGASALLDNVDARIHGWWAIVAALGGATLAGRGAFTALFAVVSLLALREFITVSAASASDRRALLAVYFAFTPIQYWLAATDRFLAFALIIPVCGFLVLPFLVAASADTRDYLARATQVFWGAMLCVYCISYVPALFMIDVPGRDLQTLLVVYLLTIVGAGDVLQFLWGKVAGHRRIAPALSPEKTVVGFLGGLASTMALGAALRWMTPFTTEQSIAVSGVVTVVGFCGGLVMSAIKRDRGRKDWGRLIPGHGGMLDRVDSLCFAAPAFFYIARWLLAPAS